MNKRFATLIAALEPTLQELLALPTHKPLELPKDAPHSGIYLFSEMGKPLYTGRSRRIPKRLSNHCRKSATHKMAAFAFLLAREMTGYSKPSYKLEDSRADLMRNPEFVTAFETAKERIRKMDVRFIEETDPIRQYILEVYVAVALQTPYNNFDTH